MTMKGVVLLLILAFISPLVTEHGRIDESIHEDSAISGKTIPRKIHNWIRFDGEWYNCDLERNIDSHGVFCSCPFLACTGHPLCTGLMQCEISKSYYYLDIERKDCKCRRFY
ncbi:hypothetical protein AWC38_SpisGene11307 [Stylophora pistillata]|uniref:Uncharacterized protein n=1 Tax=Stylophora pistillata TaxID=50429 RepID=A0A2B4S6D7_STYPI|nr:hypothetical protein AWC38_SpisGene11307 [Stylophora pistillata]